MYFYLFSMKFVKLLNIIKLILKCNALKLVAVIEWYLNLQLSMQSVPITTDVVSSNVNKVYNIIW